MTDVPLSMPVAAPANIELTNGQRDVVLIARIVMAFLSLFGSLFIIFCMVKFKKFQGPQKLIMILTLCNMGDAISSLLSFGTFSHENDRPGTSSPLFKNLCCAYYVFRSPKVPKTDTQVHTCANNCDAMFFPHS